MASVLVRWNHLSVLCSGLLSERPAAVKCMLDKRGPQRVLMFSFDQMESVPSHLPKPQILMFLDWGSLL